MNRIKPQELVNEQEIKQLKMKLGFKSLDSEIMSWWREFQRKNNSRIFLKLLRDIDKRKYTPHYFFLGYLWCDGESVSEVFRYLDEIEMNKI